MTSVLRMSEAELATLEAGIGFRTLPALRHCRNDFRSCAGGHGSEVFTGRRSAPLAGMDNFTGTVLAGGELWGYP